MRAAVVRLPLRRAVIKCTYIALLQTTIAIIIFVESLRLPSLAPKPSILRRIFLKQSMNDTLAENAIAVKPLRAAGE